MKKISVPVLYKKFLPPKHRGKPLRCVTCLLDENLHANGVAICNTFYNPVQPLAVKGRHVRVEG